MCDQLSAERWGPVFAVYDVGSFDDGDGQDLSGDRSGGSGTDEQKSVAGGKLAVVRVELR